MPSIDRRRFVSSVGGLVCLLAGCTSAPPGESSTPTRTPTPIPTPTHTGTYGDFVEGPTSYPDRPSDLSESTARSYVHDAEHARTHNRLYEPDASEISVDCKTKYDTEAHGGHYVLASCSGYANYPEAHADWGQVPALYFVSSDLTVRAGDYDSQHFHCTDVFASSDPDENFAEVCEGGDAAYRAYNLHPEPHTVSVTVEFSGGGGAAETNETVLEREYTLAPAAGVEQGSVTYREGIYLLRVTLDTGAEAMFHWDLRGESPADGPPVTVLVTPAGGLDIRTVPFHEV